MNDARTQMELVKNCHSHRSLLTKLSVTCVLIIKETTFREIKVDIKETLDILEVLTETKAHCFVR